MKKLMAVGLAMFLGACAAQGEDTATTDQAVNTGTPSQSVEGCQGREPCVNALVLKAIFNSDLRLKMAGAEDNAAKPLAREVVAEWLAKDNDGRIYIQVLEGEPGTGTWDVSISLMEGHETEEDEGDIAALPFSFTLKGDTIVEKEVQASLAG